MGLILDILNIAPRVKKRAVAGEDIREVFLEELNKEIAQSHTSKSKEVELKANECISILSENEDIDNGYIYDKETGETLREL